MTPKRTIHSTPATLLTLLAVIVVACGQTNAPSAASSAAAPAAPSAQSAGSSAASTAASSPALHASPTPPTDLSANQLAALDTVTKVDDHPLYTMRYRASYEAAFDPGLMAAQSSAVNAGCSLFATLADKQNVLYGRNFDWDYTPGLMLFYTPVDGYASVSMVSTSFLGYTSRLEKSLDSIGLADRQQLLNAPSWSFDGMNAKGLVAGFARVPTGKAPYDPQKLTISSIYVIHEMLDHAATVDEAIAVVESYNVWFGPKVPVHYLVADRSGKAALIEFTDGKLVVTRNQQAWHWAVNWLPADPGTDPDGAAWRYKILSEKLPETHGSLSARGAMDLLASIKSSTQWSVVYHPNTGDVEVVMGMDYANVHTFHLDMQP